MTITLLSPWQYLSVGAIAAQWQHILLYADPVVRTHWGVIWYIALTFLACYLLFKAIHVRFGTAGIRLRIRSMHDPDHTS